MIELKIGDPIPLVYQENDTQVTILFDGNSSFTLGTKLRKAQGIYQFIRDRDYTAIQLAGDPNSNFLAAFTFYFYTKKIPTYNIHISRSGYMSGNRILSQRFSTKYINFRGYKEEFFSEVHPEFFFFNKTASEISQKRQDRFKIFCVPKWGISKYSIENIQSMINKIFYIYNINTIYIDIGSGFTYLSFLNNKNLGNVNVVGVCIGLPKAKMIRYLQELESQLFGKISVYELIEPLHKDKFGLIRKDDLELIDRMRDKNINLEPIYSVKTFRRILEEKENKNKVGIFYFHQGALLPGINRVV